MPVVGCCDVAAAAAAVAVGGSGDPFPALFFSDNFGGGGGGGRGVDALLLHNTTIFCGFACTLLTLLREFWLLEQWCTKTCLFFLGLWHVDRVVLCK